MFYKACTKHVPVLLCTAKLAQSTSQYYFVLQSLQKLLPSTTLYYKACTKYFPVLLCTTKLVQSRSQYYFVLQSLHKVLPSTTLYYKACTESFPVLLCTAKLAQSRSQYYFDNYKADTKHLSSSAAATLHRKTQGFVLRLPPQHKPHATSMQPLQCVSQHHVANLNLSTHMATPDDNNHAAIPMRSATTESKTPYNYARTSAPKAAWSHRYNAAKKKANRPQPRYLSSSAAATLHGKTKRFRAPASSPTQTPCNIHAAITMLFAASRRKPAPIYAHGNTRWQQSCSHSNAFCNHRFQNTLKLRTHKHTQSSLKPPLHCGKKKANRPQPQPPHAGRTFHRRRQPLYTEKQKVSCSGFLPNTNSMQHSCSHYNAFCSITSQTCTYLRTWQHQMTTIMQPFQCVLQPQIPKHPKTTHAQAHPKQLEATVTLRQKKGKPTAAATAARRTYLSSSAAATLHGKTQGFVLRLPPQHKPHATFMQSLKSILQHSLHHHVA